MKNLKIVITLSACLTGFSLWAAPQLVLGLWKTSRNSSLPASMSCIAWAGGTTFYTVGDDAGSNENYLYKFTAVPGSYGTNVVSQTYVSKVALENVYDIEGIAFDPGSGCIWCANECASTSYGAELNEIAEFNVTTGKRTGRKASLPAWFNAACLSNYSIESLTISPDGLTMWTANEEALTCDGSRSTPSAGTLCRLVKFTRATIYDNWVCTSMYAYLTEHWVEGSGFSSNRRGISDLTALPDGGLLVLERDLSGSSSLSADFYYSIFYISPASFAAATDVIGNTSLKTNTAYTKVTKTAVVNNHAPEIWINVEGMCLGPIRSVDATPTLWLCTDAGDGTTNKRLVSNALWGIVVRDYTIAPPASGTSSLVGGPYRCTNGAPVKVELSGVPGLTPVAYTNNGAVLYSASWNMLTNQHNQTAAKWYGGTGAKAEFRVWYDTQFTWTVTPTGAATSEIYDHDTFEDYAAGTSVTGGSVTKWSGEGVVTSLTYAPATPPGYALARANHTKVLTFDEVERTISGVTSSQSKMEIMMMVVVPTKALADCSAEEQLAIGVNNDGRVYLWTLDPKTLTRQWVRISDKVYANGTWVRVGIELDYTTNPDAYAFCRIRLDGSICTSAQGMRAPDNLTTGGGWHYLARNRTTGGVTAISRIKASGMQLDDFVYEKGTAVSEHTGATSVDGVPFSWFDSLGLPRDPTAAPPVNTKYATLKEVALAGVDPYQDEELAITDIRFDAAGHPILEFNAYKGDQPTAGFTVIEANSLADLLKASGATPAQGTVSGDAKSWSSEWKGSSTASEGKFYLLKAN